MEMAWFVVIFADFSAVVRFASFNSRDFGFTCNWLELGFRGSKSLYCMRGMAKWIGDLLVYIKFSEILTLRNLAFR